jgi:aminomethyltransferase
VPIEIGPEEAIPVPPKTTPLNLLHLALGARMVPFAGWSMPVQYGPGVLAEHLHCRADGCAALFDVSHMGQASLHGAAGGEALEALVPGDIQGLKPNRQRYTVLTNEAGGVIDDLMVSRLAPDHLFMVVNASRAGIDLPHIEQHLPAGVTMQRHTGRALLALQGPGAAAVMGRLGPVAAGFPFMGFGPAAIGGIDCLVSRSGYTGEDGFEISVAVDDVENLARLLLDQPEVQPAGLGARDSLRLEAGLCLYGNDLDELTSPIEADIAWVIGKRRRQDWAFPGGAAIRDQLQNGCARVRVGIRPDGRAPARAGTTIVADDGTAAGTVTSGGFGPSLNAPVAMGYVRRDLAPLGTELFLKVRGRSLPAHVAPMPFFPHRYVR